MSENLDAQARRGLDAELVAPRRQGSRVPTGVSDVLRAMQLGRQTARR